MSDILSTRAAAPIDPPPLPAHLREHLVRDLYAAIDRDRARLATLRQTAPRGALRRSIAFTVATLREIRGAP